jgi:hypothetical protein
LHIDDRQNMACFAGVVRMVAGTALLSHVPSGCCAASAAGACVSRHKLANHALLLGHACCQCCPQQPAIVYFSLYINSWLKSLLCCCCNFYAGCCAAPPVSACVGRPLFNCAGRRPSQEGRAPRAAA